MSTAGRMFQLRLDPITGNSEWVVIEDEEEEDEDEGFSCGPTKPMLATTSYLDMLNDNPRNGAYRAAIDKVVTKPCHVLDIGAGTGLLSMMAARAMEADNSSTCVCSKGLVTSCESYLPMVKLMRKVLRVNCMEHKVLLINKRSDELEVGVDIASRADVLVSEILDSELLGEGLIPTLQHAHEKLLVENPQTVPYRATTYGQLVESTYLWKLHDLFRSEEKVGDGIYLVPKGMEGIIGVKPQQFAMHCDAMKEDIRLLSEPFKVFDFDFWKRPNSKGEAKLQIRANGDGTVHAVISWWILQLESEGKIFYSTAPRWINTPLQINDLQSSIPCARTWCDHWKQCVCFSPGKGLSVCKDENICLDAIHTNSSISYIFKAQPPIPEIDHQDYQITLSPERIAIYGDNNWRFSMLKAIKTALHKNGSPLCVVADDSVFLTIAVAQLSKTSHVMSLFPGLREKGSQYLQAVAVENGYSMDRVEVVSKRKQQLSMDDTHHKKVDLLIAEPFYYGCEGMLPWQNLKFWNKRTILDSVLSEDVQVIPWKGILRASAMCLPDLWRSRCSLKEIEGFDHSVVNTTLGGCGDLPASHEIPCLPFFIWQCGEVKKLSEIHTIMEFDFLKPITACCGKIQIEFTEPGICHGFALWIDWIMDMENSIVVTTGPDQRYWKQGVKLLNKPVAVEKRNASSGGHCSAIVEAYFDPLSGELSLKHEFS